MALAGFAPEAMRPMALMLNLFVSSIGVIRFSRVAGFRWDLFLPFAGTSIPASFLAGWLLELDPTLYRWTLGLILLFAAYRLIFRSTPDSLEAVRKLSIPTSLAYGAVFGLICGLTGVAGGIFLGPLLILMRWATAKQTAAVCSAFILVNSFSGLVGLFIAALNAQVQLPLTALPVAMWVVAVLFGGIIGSGIGSRHLSPLALRRVLAVVLVIAAARMLTSDITNSAAETPPPASSAILSRYHELI